MKNLTRLALGAALIATAATASAQVTLLSDNFNSSSTVPTTYSAFSGTPRSISVNNAVMGSNALQLNWGNGATGTNASAWTYFNTSATSQTLAVGDSLKATFKIAFTDSDGGSLIVSPTSFRFGFFNTPTTTLAAPATTSPLGIASNFASSAANNTFAVTGGTNAGTGVPISGTFSAGQTGAGDFGTSLAGTVSFTLTLTATGTYREDVSFLPSGASTPNSYSFTGLSSSLTSFSGLGFANTTFGQVSGGVVPITLIDDLVITYTAIPEPSTYAAFAGLSVLALAATRRRRA
jgi:hypothetical protein